ncbi:Polysaccharide biosynthesis protein, partial [Haemophilus influenzae]|jgi:hypothetical protein
VFR